jgi:hypothetical protein
LEVAPDAEKKIYLVDDTAAGDEIKYVIVVGNFGVTPITTQPFFQETGIWYNMMDNSPFEVSNMAMSFSLEPGEYRIFANGISVLDVETPPVQKIVMYPNPATNMLHFSTSLDAIKIYDVSGKLIKEYATYQASTPLYIQELKSGMYFISVQHNGNVQTIKLLKK